MSLIRTSATLLALTIWWGCGVDKADSPQGQPRRGIAVGKADMPGACKHGEEIYCGGQSPDGCYCDELCSSYNDCCTDDFAAVCGENSDDNQQETALLEQEVKDYQVLFTNPTCSGLSFSAPIPTADGTGQRLGKPPYVYCNGSDFGPAGARQLSPQHKLIEWISALQAGDELFLAYLSYSNSSVHSALCQAAKDGVKITFVLDSASSLSGGLKNCAPSQVTILTRGHQGGIGYAHNKLLMINPNGDDEYIKLSFSSGNMSSGAVIHHENWHFIEVKRASFFAQAHRCLMQAQLDEVASSSTANYRSFVNTCRQAIVEEMGYPEEQDFKIFIIPNTDDHKALRLAVAQSTMSAAEIDIAAHRFGTAYGSFSHDGVQYKGFQQDLVSRLQQTDNPVKMRMVADDDLYWLLPFGEGKPFGASSGFTVGLNQRFEAHNTRKLYEAGDGQRFEIRYLETNHAYSGDCEAKPSRTVRLHHNKFIIYRGRPGQPDAVLCGAANFTGSGFKSNFENIYWTTMPAVVQAFNKQMARFWDGTRFAEDDQDPPVATAPGQMPAELPPRDADPCWNR